MPVYESDKNKSDEEYRCQFCGEESPAAEWDDDKCPKCGEEYDPILAQEGGNNGTN